MANTLTPAEMARIRGEIARGLNWDSMPAIWRWRWAVLLSGEGLESKFYALVLSCFPDFGRGISPEIDELAAIAGRQPRTVINHTNKLHKEGFAPRESGNGRGHASHYELAIPVATQFELAGMLGVTFEPERAIPIKIKVQSDSPFQPKKVQQDSPYRGEKVQHVSPFTEKRCNWLHEKVKPDSPTLFSTSKNTESAVGVPPVGGNGAKRPRAKREPAPGVEMFLDDYLRAMMAQPAKGSAPARQRAMEPNATAVKKQWAKLTQAQADAARAHIPQHARNKGAFMLNPENYLEQRVWERQSQGAAPDLDAKRREIHLHVLMQYAQTNEWPSEARDEWGSPPGINGSKVPQELWREAQSRVRQMDAGGGHAHV